MLLFLNHSTYREQCASRHAVADQSVCQSGKASEPAEGTNTEVIWPTDYFQRQLKLNQELLQFKLLIWGWIFHIYSKFQSNYF